MKKTLLTLFAIFAMAFSAKADWYEGECGENLIWQLNTETVTLTINGSGDMYNFAVGASPWFSYSDYLEYVNIGDSVTSIGNKAFHECTSIKSVHIGNSVTFIGEFAFAGCSRLHKVHISDSVKAIKKCAFEYCESLRDITIPKSVEEIQRDVFYESNKLESIVVDPENEKFDSRDNCNGIVLTKSDKLIIACKKTVVPNTVKIVGFGSFADIDIESVDIPNSVKRIEGGAFWCCDKLKHLTLGDSLEIIENGGISSCDQIEEIYIPKSLISIGIQPFYSCNGLKSLIVDPENEIFDSRENCNAIIVTETNELVKGCDNTVLPTSIRSIGREAFLGCEGIQSVVIPDSVTSIGYNAYYSCSNLDSLVLPAALKTIGSSAFCGCGRIKTIHCFATTPPECADNAFSSMYSIYDNAILYVPFGCVKAYKEAEIWKDFWNIVELPEDYSVNENQALAVSIFPNPATVFVNINCENMTNIDIFTMDGKLANRIVAQSDEIQVDMNMLPVGTYFFRIETKEGFITRKIVKK